MKRYDGGTKVNGGYYLSLESWEVSAIDEAGGTLPDGPGERFVQVPRPVLIMVTPVVGGAFVLSLPFIGVGLALHELGKRVLVRKKKLVKQS